MIATTRLMTQRKVGNLVDNQQSEWKTIGSTPVSADAPAGGSVRYDPDFELLQAEVQKLENLSGGSVDWGRVVVLSKELLQSKSKDLLVNGYLAMGLLETEGIAGLSNGIACMEGMVAEFWPTLFPAKKRMRARINALSWLSEKAGVVISRHELEPNDTGAYTDCAKQAKALETLLEEKMGQDAPSLADLYRPIQEQLNRLSADAVTPQQTEAAQSSEPESQPATPATSGPATSIKSPEDSKRMLRDSVSALKRVTSFKRSQDLSDPLPYRLIRSLTWCEIDKLPPADQGKSRIPPPPAHLRNSCQSLFEQSAWKELVSQAESKIGEFPFWLDLHRMSERALAGLGPDYAMARRAVKAEVCSLLDRLPELLEYKFSDGTPFCDEETQRWASTVLFPAPEVETAEVPTSEDAEDSLNELRKESRSLLKEEKQNDAFRLVQDAMRSTAVQRRRFLIQLELSRLCLETGQKQAALAHLESLDEQISRFSLDVWEPGLTVEVLQVYWTALRDVLRASKQAVPEISQRVDSVYSRLCKIDVLTGLKLMKK